MELDFWRLIGGLGLFLYGMHQLEGALKELAGRPFKRFLRHYTQRPWKSALAGAISTAALQSSSVVSLIVLAFVGTGIISLSSGIGIGFGSNLGTTVTGWIVATLGFKVAIETLALPLVALGGFGIVWLRRGARLFGFFGLLVGLGLMLLGLDYMKGGAVGVATLFDPVALRNYPPIPFLAVGFLITAVIQSSSATITITLSALYAGVIPLSSAAAVAIGADLGTTITAILGAMAGSAAKKRVAASLVLFNGVTDAIAFLLLHPLLFVVTSVLGIQDPLYALVGFHSLFNLMGVLLFLPWVGWLSCRLELLFVGDALPLLRYLKDKVAQVPDVAIDNMMRETCRLIDQAAAYNQQSFGLHPVGSFYRNNADREEVPVFDRGADLDHCYSELKHLEGQILSYALSLQSEKLERHEALRLSQIFPAIRNAVHSAKYLRGIQQDLRAFRDSADDAFNAYYERFKGVAREFYVGLESLKRADLPDLRFEQLVELKNRNESGHSEVHAQIYREVSAGHLSEVQISTLLNVNRVLFLGNQSLLSALADTLLDAEREKDFSALLTGA